MIKIIFGIIFSFSFLFAGEINVAVAANVSYAIDELKKEFNNLYSDTKVQIILGGSGKLTAQIKNGAPYHIFMSANMKYPQSLYDDGVAFTKPVVYAQGSLAILSSNQKDFSKGISIVKDENIKKIAIANPKTAPYGVATIEALKNIGLLDEVKSKFVYGESISQTVSYAITAADIGFIAKSSLFDSKMSMYKEGINWIDVDTKLYTPINQGIVILKNAENNSEAKAFYEFILSKKAKDILKRFGYTNP